MVFNCTVEQLRDSAAEHQMTLTYASAAAGENEVARFGHDQAGHPDHSMKHDAQHDIVQVIRHSSLNLPDRRLRTVVLPTIGRPVNDQTAENHRKGAGSQ